MSSFQAVKIAIIQAVGVSKDAIHIYLGFAVFVAMVIFGRQRHGSYAALFPVLWFQ